MVMIVMKSMDQIVDILADRITPSKLENLCNTNNLVKLLEWAKLRVDGQI